MISSSSDTVWFSLLAHRINPPTTSKVMLKHTSCNLRSCPWIAWLTQDQITETDHSNTRLHTQADRLGKGKIRLPKEIGNTQAQKLQGRSQMRWELDWIRQERRTSQGIEVGTGRIQFPEKPENISAVLCTYIHTLITKDLSHSQLNYTYGF